MTAKHRTNRPQEPSSESKGFAPTDEQRLATTTCAPFVLVSASAGTGKTYTLINRALELLRGGVPLERLLIITFTHKAADELKERLYEAFSNDPTLRPLRLKLPQAFVSTIDAFCSRVLREHAIDAGIDPAFRLIGDPDKQIALEEIMDDIFHHWYLGRSDEDEVSTPDSETIPITNSQSHREFLRLIELCKFKGSREILREELLRLMNLARTHPDPDEFISTLRAGLESDDAPYLQTFARMLLSCWRSAVSIYERVLTIGQDAFPDKRFEKHQAALGAMQNAPRPWRADHPGEEPSQINQADLSQMTADFEVTVTKLEKYLRDVGLLKEIGPWKFSFPSLPRGTGNQLTPLNEFAKKTFGNSAKPGPFQWLPADLSETNTQYSLCRPTLETLIALLKQIMTRYRDFKAERGLLDFADLEYQASRLLASGRSGLADQFDLVMVDEFQDVNQLQAGIVKQLNPSLGRFLVGDIKQCIYQFRLSDPSIFRELFEGAHLLRPDQKESDKKVSADAVRLYMSENFRSRYPVLQIVNSVFETLFTPAMIGGDYEAEALRYHSSEEAGPQPDHTQSAAAERPGWAPVEIHLFDKAPTGQPGRINPALAAEAQLVAKRIHELRSESFPVYDKNEKSWRPVRYSDIVIILRSPGPTGGPFAETLQSAGIPVDFGNKDYFSRPEIRDCLCLLRLINNSHDDISLAAVLRSPAADFSDDDLCRLRLLWPESLSLLATLKATGLGLVDEWSGRKLDSINEEDNAPLAAKSLRFLNQLDQWRRQIGSADLAETIASVLSESGLMEVAMAGTADSDSLGNLEQFLNLARTYSQNRDHGLPGFIQYLEEMIENDAGPESIMLPTEAGDAVKIISLHKSKGLEFPVVFLSLYGKKFNDKDSSNKLLTDKDWLGVDLFDPQSYLVTPTIAHRIQSAKRKQEVREEEMRIMYVALTRAKEKLIITGHTLSKIKKIEQSLPLWKGSSAVPESQLLSANSPLDWLLGALAHRGLLTSLGQPGETTQLAPWLHFTQHDAEEITPNKSAPQQPELPLEAANDEITTNEPGISPADQLAQIKAELPELATRLSRQYRHGPATRWLGKYWVTEIKQLIDRETHEEEQTEGTALSFGEKPKAIDDPTLNIDDAAPIAEDSSPTPGVSTRAKTGGGSKEGTWLHTLLEAIDIGTTDPDSIMRTAAELGQGGRIPLDWITKKNLAPIFNFFSSPLGQEMCDAASSLEREVSFSLKLSPSSLAKIWPSAEELDESEWFLIQGQIDAIWRRKDGSHLLLDFKSDSVFSEAAIKKRAEHYKSQILLYREAVERLWNTKEISCQLYFLRAGRSIEVYVPSS